MNETELYELIRKYEDDSKKVSKEAEKLLIDYMIEIISKIEKIKNMFGRSYSGKYPTDGKILESPVYKGLLYANKDHVKVTNICDDYIYIEYLSGIESIHRTRIPIDKLIYFSNQDNIDNFTNKIIEAERQYLLDNIIFLEKNLSECKNKYEKFCEKYHIKK